MNDYWLDFVIGTFVTYFLSYSFAKLDGPFGLFIETRSFLFHRFPKPWVQKGVTCPFCISFYAGFLVALAVFFIAPLAWWGFFFLWFGYTGASMFLNGLT